MSRIHRKSGALVDIIRQAPPGGSAFDDFFIEHFPLLVKYLRKQGMSDVDAQDIAQESLYKLTRYRDLPAHALKALMYRISLNALCDLRRREASVRHHHFESDFPIPEIPDETPQPEQWAEHREELARVRDAIDRLPERCKEIYLLNRIDGMSYSQISRHCGVSVKAVEKHIGKALSSLRTQLGPHALPGGNHQAP